MIISVDFRWLFLINYDYFDWVFERFWNGIEIEVGDCVQCK